MTERAFAGKWGARREVARPFGGMEALAEQAGQRGPAQAAQDLLEKPAKIHGHCRTPK